MSRVKVEGDDEPAVTEVDLWSMAVSWACIAAAVILFGVMYVTSVAGFLVFYSLPKLVIEDGGRTALKLAATVALAVVTAEIARAALSS